MLLERETELTALRKALFEVESGEGALVLIEGPVGVGTTSLLRELAKLGENSGACVLRAGGAQLERRLPLGVVRQLVLPLPAEEGNGIPEASRAMLGSVSAGSGVRPCGEGEEGVLASVLHGLHTMLVGLGAGRTVVLLVDDLHWADEASLRALAFLGARLDGMRVLIGVVVQNGAGARDPLVREVARAATHHLHPEALSPEATAKLVATRFGGQCDTEFASACHDLTGGSPKELRVLLDRVRSHRLSGRQAEVPRILELGESFRRERALFLMRRDPVVAAYATAVVVLAEQATDDLVSQLSGLSPQDCVAARQLLRKAWLLDGSGTVRDPAMTRAIAETMEAGESSRLHRAAAVLLDENGAAPEAIATQLLHVDALRDRWEVDQLRAAAVAARRRAAPESAVRYLRRALQDLPGDGRERATLLVELAAAELGTEPASAIRHLAQAAPLMPDRRGRAAVVSWTPLPVAAGDPQIAELVSEVAAGFGDATTLRGYDRELALRLEARSRYAGFQDSTVLSSAKRRLGELGPADLADSAERELRLVLLQAAMLNGQLGHREVASAARQILEYEPTNSVQMGSALQIVPSMLLAAGDGDAASSWLDAAQVHVQQQRTPMLAPLVESQRSLVLLGRGEFAMARDSALRAFSLAGRDVPGSIVMPAVSLGVVACVMRDQRRAAQVLEVQGFSTDLRMFVVRRLIRGELAVAEGDLPAALAQHLDCGRLLDRAGWVNPAISNWQVAAALLHHKLGQLTEAVELAEENLRRACSWGEPVTMGRALQALGMVTAGEPGVALLRQSVDMLNETGSRLELSAALTALGKRLHAHAPDEGDRLLARGRRLAEQLWAGDGDERSRGLVQAVTSPSGSVARSVLTRGENTVAELAASGLSNQEIADELDISRRAVEKHLTSSYRKLGIVGRSALAAVLGAE